MWRRFRRPFSYPGYREARFAHRSFSYLTPFFSFFSPRRSQECLPHDRKIWLGCRKHYGKRFTSLPQNCNMRYGFNQKRGRMRREIGKSVSIKHGLRTADYGLRTGYKIRTRYNTRTGYKIEILGGGSLNQEPDKNAIFFTHFRHGLGL